MVSQLVSPPPLMVRYNESPAATEVVMSTVLLHPVRAVRIGACSRPGSNGRIILVRPLQRPGRNVVLLDVQAGLVVYKAGRELRLLRLSDGRETRVPATAADPNTLYSRFGTPGLVVSHDRVVQVIPAARLAELLDAAG